LSLLLVLYSAPRGFSLGTPVFPFVDSNSIWIIVEPYHYQEPLARVIA